LAGYSDVQSRTKIYVLLNPVLDPIIIVTTFYIYIVINQIGSRMSWRQDIEDIVSNKLI